MGSIGVPSMSKHVVDVILASRAGRQVIAVFDLMEFDAVEK
jgi:hypothetical protein